MEVVLVFVLQTIAVLALVAWIVVKPPRSAAGIAAQVAGSLLLLMALARIGLWLFPPWWTPYLAAIIIGVAGARLVVLRRWRSLGPRGWGWFHAVLFAGFGTWGAAIVGGAISASRPPAQPVPVDLAFPLPPGSYLVANGGNALMLNAHRASMDTSVARLQPWRGNGHALDLIAVDGFGLRASGILPRAPDAYRIFGTPVLAPCAGTIELAVDGLRDMPVPQFDRANLAGNHVILGCGDVQIVLAHLRQGSVRVQVGDRVGVGDRLGEVGNSGGTSEPHLHIHAQRPGSAAAPMGGDPVPMLLAGRYPTRNARIRVREQPAGTTGRTDSMD
jgi:hypothetical protein